MKKNIATAIFIVICAVLVFVGFYFVLQKNKQQSEVEVSEVQYLIMTDIERNYPTTPRALVNLYCRMLACMYNEEYSDEELEKLLSQMYLLYDDELKEANPISKFQLSMQTDLLSKENDGYRISDYIIPDTDEVTKKQVDGKDMALLTVSFYVKDESGFSKTYQDFVLRKDSSGLWRIYGYSVHS